ncbi:4Fe-4S binding protein [Butyrivibrio sp. YAB3001]|uniref:4Fe-4S binding protein n=1 Tax=Butyrivibrio sp. YAB3001 TaxID=1520812 RepID=UPI0008F659AD|nr:4Fe-4S binding protein [Butyrivibrio sp. YAB3001]SFB99960.1 4Fe-4S binding domain-containing protein [Butyrivibrio sp. YAB3001]
MGNNRLKKHGLIRKGVQAAWGIISNGYLKGFLTASIYKGPLKNFCVPGMNCYSCPGALGACPIGAMQSIFDARRRKFAFYVVGYLAAIGLLVGRFICGWLCLFGLIEELLYKIPVPKLTVPKKLDKIMRYFKYAILLVMVFALPFFYRSKVGSGDPFFCKYICPVGTLEGGIPLVLLRSSMRSAVGALFRWKFAILILCVLASMFIYRPFCKYICPLGAFYALFQKVSLLKLSCDKDACVNCGACAKTCKMNVDPVQKPNSAECIRCGECTKVCPKNALSFQRKTLNHNLSSK